MLEALKAKMVGGRAQPRLVIAGSARGKTEVRFARWLFGLEDRLALYRDLVSLMDAGVPYVAAMTQYRNGIVEVMSAGDHRVIFLDEVLYAINRGATLAQAIDGWVSESERVLIESGERGNNLIEAFRNAGKAASASQRMRQTMWAALSAPAMDLVILVATIVYIGVSFVPEISRGQNPSRDWSGAPWWLWATGWFTTHWGWLVALLVVVAATLALRSLSGAPIRIPGTQKRLLPGFVGGLRDRVDRFVPWSVYRDMQAAGMLVSFGVLLSTGVPLAESLNRLQRSASPYLQDKLRRMLLGLSRGLEDQQVWNVGLLPPEKAVSLAIFSKTPKFQQAVSQMGDEIVEQTLKSIEARVNRQALYLRLFVTGYTSFIFIAISQLQNVLGK